MHRTLRSARAACTVLATLAAIGLSYRIWRASTLSAIDLITAVSTAVLTVGTLGAGWVMHIRKVRAEQRAERAAWATNIQRRQEVLLDGDEDRELWESTPVVGNDQDTCAFGTQVVVLDQHRREWGQQAG